MVAVKTAGGEADPKSALKSDFSMEHRVSLTSYKQCGIVYVGYISGTQ